MRWILLALPWLELLTLIQLGVETSALIALLYVMASFVLGLMILRYQGFNMLEQVRRQQEQGVPMGARLLKDDMAIGFAGILLMIPGMITDTLAVLALIGPLRRRLLGAFSPTSDRPDVTYTSRASASSYRDRADTHSVIEGEYQRVDD